MTTIVYGASDDLIEVEGDLMEEFDSWDASGDVLTFSNGLQISVTYGKDGVWRLEPLTKFLGNFEWVAAPNPEGGRDENDIPEYSERIIITDNVTWVTYKSGRN